jgi:anti-sigma factor RsiW
MTECQAPELQDLFPEYVADMLDDAERSRVHEHLADCSSCARDVALLRTVRAMRPQPVTLDTERMARIVAALPKPPRRGQAEHPLRPMLVRTVDPVARENTERPLAPSIAAPTRRRRLTTSSLWRIAATFTVIVAGASSVLVARHQSDLQASNPTQLAALESLPAPALFAESLSSMQGIRSSLMTPPDVPVSYGDLGDYTEEELQVMLERLDQWDGATSTDPLPGLPIVATREGAL